MFVIVMTSIFLLVCLPLAFTLYNLIMLHNYINLSQLYLMQLVLLKKSVFYIFSWKLWNLHKHNKAGKTFNLLNQCKYKSCKIKKHQNWEIHKPDCHSQTQNNYFSDKKFLKLISLINNWNLLKTHSKHMEPNKITRC